MSKLQPNIITNMIDLYREEAKFYQSTDKQETFENAIQALTKLQKLLYPYDDIELNGLSYNLSDLIQALKIRSNIYK